jgi:acyl-CoA reductase-like NAD-dependent aldehyde dehydrogenase
MAEIVEFYAYNENPYEYIAIVKGKHDSSWNNSGRYVRESDYAALRAEAEKDYEDMRRFQKAYIEADQECRHLRAEVERLRGENENLLAVIETEKQIMTTLSETEADLAAAVEVLRQYADPNNWGYYDDSGCEKGRGKGEDACFIGPGEARAFLSRLEVK